MLKSWLLMWHLELGALTDSVRWGHEGGALVMGSVALWNREAARLIGSVALWNTAGLLSALAPWECGENTAICNRVTSTSSASTTTWVLAFPVPSTLTGKCSLCNIRVCVIHYGSPSTQLRRAVPWSPGEIISKFCAALVLPVRYPISKNQKGQTGSR